MTPVARAACVLVLASFAEVALETGHRFFAGAGVVLIFMALAGRKEEQ